MRITAGILTIIGGFIGGSLWLQITRELITNFAKTFATADPASASSVAIVIAPFIILIGLSPVFLSVLGGYYTLKRKHWRWALAGAICSLLFPFTGIPAVILLIKSKGEF